MNTIGSSEDSLTTYIVCADKPNAPSSPTLETATQDSITIAWNAPSSNGGSAITGYKVYMNDYLTDTFELIYDGTNVDSILTF